MTTKLPLHEVAYFNAEHSKFSVKNLLKGSGKWTTPVNPKLEKLEAEFSLGSPAKITRIDIGNYWTSSVEVVVGLSTWPQNKREVLLPSQIFMNRMQCMTGDNKETMKFLKSKEHFSAEVASKKWDRVKIICHQPFRRESDIFGLSMFVLYGEKSESNRKSLTPVNGSPLAKNPPNNGLEHFMKNKLDMSGVLKSLENRNNLNENPKSFRKETEEFLENCGFSKLSFAEIEQVTFRKVKDSWKEKGGRELTKDEKEALKIISTDYLTKLASGDSAPLNKRGLDEMVAVDKAPKKKLTANIINMRKDVDINEQISKNKHRNYISTMDIHNDYDEGFWQESKVTKKKDVHQRKKKTPEKVPGVTGIGKTSTPIANKISPISKKTRSPSNESYNPNKLLEFSKVDLLKKGVLVQNYCYKKNKELPLKNGVSLSVKKQTPVTFYKIGSNIHMYAEGVFYKPDVQPEHLASLFKDFKSEEIENPVSSSVIDDIFGEVIILAELVHELPDNENREEGAQEEEV